MSTIERITIFCAVVALVGGCIWFGFATHKAGVPESPKTVPSAPVPVATASPTPTGGLVSSVLQVQVGEVGAIDAGNGQTDVAGSATVLLGMARAGAARNQKAYDHYFDTGQAYRVPDGTRAKLVIGGDQANQVQFVDGAHVGKFGWIPAEWIRPTNSIPRKDRTN